MTCFFLRWCYDRGLGSSVWRGFSWPVGLIESRFFVCLFGWLVGWLLLQQPVDVRNDNILQVVSRGFEARKRGQELEGLNHFGEAVALPRLAINNQQTTHI